MIGELKDWTKIVTVEHLIPIFSTLQNKARNTIICPKRQLVFKAFEVCPYDKLKVVMLGQDPYPQKDISIGIAFGNKDNTPDDKLSPSLQVLKEACINYEIPHNPYVFDNTLEYWGSQGVLLLNSALTCELGRPNSHLLLWRPFISQVLNRLSMYNPGLIYVLFGYTAKTFKPYIKNGHIVEIEHPAWFVRTGKKMPSKLFTDINKLLKTYFDTTIEWYKEI